MKTMAATGCTAVEDRDGDAEAEKMRKIWIRMSTKMRKTGSRMVIVATILMNK